MRPSFYAFCGVIALLFAAAVIAAGTGIRPHSHPRAALSEAKPDTNPMHSLAARRFAHDLQGTANAASDKYKDGYHMSHATCVQGGPQDFVCAFMLKVPSGKVECNVAHVHRGPTGFEPLAAGKVHVPVAKCTALNAFKSF